MIKKLQSAGFTFAHIQIMIAAAAVLAGLAYFQTKTREPEVFTQDKNGQALTKGEEDSRSVEQYANELAKQNSATGEQTTGAVLGNATDQPQMGQDVGAPIRIQPRGPSVAPASN